MVSILNGRQRYIAISTLMIFSSSFFVGCDSVLNKEDTTTTATTTNLKKEWLGTWEYLIENTKFQITFSEPNKYEMKGFRISTNASGVKIPTSWFSESGTISVGTPQLPPDGNIPLTFKRSGAMRNIEDLPISLEIGKEWSWIATFQANELIILQSCPEYVGCVTPVYKRVLN